MWHLWSSAVLTIFLSVLCLRVNGIETIINRNITWCTASEGEQMKCEAFSKAVVLQKTFFDNDVVLQCKQAFNREECMIMLDQEKAHLTTLDPGEMFTAGRYHSLVPIMQEEFENGLTHQYAVAVIKKGSLQDVENLYDLRGKKACFAGVGTFAGWVLPVETLMRRGGMKIIDCNNHVKSVIKYFGPSCAVNSLIDKYNPLGDNSHQLCKLCIGKVPGGLCTNTDPYAGHAGAFRCLVEAGEIAFVLHTTVQEMTSTTFDFIAHSVKKEQFELLCLDGSRKPVDEYGSCNWGKVTSRAIVTSSATNSETREFYQDFLKRAVRLFGKNSNTTNTYNDYFGNGQGDLDNRGRYNENGYGNGYNNPTEYKTDDNENRNNYDGAYDGPNRWDKPKTNHSDFLTVQPIETFSLFESAPRYGSRHNLMFSDLTHNFASLRTERQKYNEYLGKSLDIIMNVRRCPVNRMALCVTSDPELDKCRKMKIALDAQLLKPELTCYKGNSHINCMQLIYEGAADIAVLDASDVYTAGLRFDLIPFMSEVYNLGTPDYYVVAVAKEEDMDTDLTYLKNKYTCHTGINMAAGWVYPMAYLISNSWIRGYGCDSVRAAAEYFSKSCVPGALSVEYNSGRSFDNMCHLCHGGSYRYCRRDASEDYFGHTGALRCLVEGGGDVAFVKHTTVLENTDGKRREWWARNALTKDFQLLCPDGTRRSTLDYARCNLGKVAANAVVTRGGNAYDEGQIDAFVNLLVYAQQFYGRKEQDEFSFGMFYSLPPYADLIFQDAAQQLVVVPPERRRFDLYLGSDFMRARRIVDCTAGTAPLGYSVLATVATAVFVQILAR